MSCEGARGSSGGLGLTAAFLLPRRSKAKLKLDIEQLEEEQKTYAATWLSRLQSFDSLVEQLTTMSDAIKCVLSQSGLAADWKLITAVQGREDGTGAETRIRRGRRRRASLDPRPRSDCI